MNYFLTVKTTRDDYLFYRERFDTLDAALKAMSAYLKSPSDQFRYTCYLALRDGEMTRLYINRFTAGPNLRDDIASISIMSELGLLEAGIYNAAPRH